ncbi:MAG: stage II sporulation protein P [Lachnospiraceae bacterium]|nr:stage II sporulation protein P [Lachnospiraceae bacterium]
MIIYIFVKLFTLFFTGSTREIIIIETKQWIGKNIKNIVCNEILKSDRYLTEDKVISIATMQKRNNEESDIDKALTLVYNAVDKYDNLIVEEVRNFANASKDKNSSNYKKYSHQRSDTSSKDKANQYELNNKIFEENMRNIENKLMSYNPSKKQKDAITKENNNSIIKQLKGTNSTSYMVKNFYTVDGSTSIDKSIFKPNLLLGINNRLKSKTNNKPQILIYHTHGSEKYADSSNKRRDSVIGVGDYLTDLLERKYGYNVIHEDRKFDVVNNKWNRNAYDTALPEIKKILKKNPSIEVVIDLHRDSGSSKTVSNIDNIKVARLMFFNGVCRSNVGPRTEIPNNNLKYNLAFSLDMQMEAMKMFPGFTKKIYLKGYRYNMHLAKRYMLVEVGNNKNTVLEAKYAMIPFAKILNKVLTTN